MSKTDTPAPSRLRRGIGGPLLFAFILGDVLGAGVYALMGVLSERVGGMLWAPLLAALVLAMLTAGSYAELVTKYPRAGGAAVFAERAFKNKLVSFLVGFCMLAAGVVSAAGLSIAFAGQYLQTFVEVPVVPVAIVFLAVLAALNARGIRESMGANFVMTAIEVSGLVIVVVVVGFLLAGGGGDVSRVMEVPQGTGVASAVLAGAIIAYYSFVGFETSANMIEEVKEPSKMYPRALFAALGAAGVVYVLVGLASSIALPPEELSSSSGPLLAVVEASGVAVPSWLFSLIALIAVANGALLTMIMASRLTYGMAEQGLLPKALSRVLPRRRTPWVAILATTLVAMLLTLVGDLALLAETVVLLLLFVFLSANVSVLVLRRDRVEHDHFRVWTFVPVLGIASCLLLLSQQTLRVWIFGAILIAVGVVLYFVARWARRRGERAV
ncbi:APC family permease [Microbacterium imperiale]|uniref:Amino acid permease n=1 Tax=Microbacterium imperiale TaxID=33884 RepID=A0A9W6HGR1_9MICO|nr:APC family permease [Microbacterium imperiale]MBP2420991.1 amino acid transporter [Microbacterium imperiale]MDS0199895.1 APC family permease [Microbacterium imperiale]BFE41333.1 APC family permease [Microbacterium imperiale]GLJ80284.1 amino acid permease [Microbacterium imperiale]